MAAANQDRCATSFREIGKVKRTFVIANEDAALEVHQVLSELQIPYAIIGGMAVQYWGEARFTQDLDLTVVIPIEEQEDTLRVLSNRLPPRRPDAIEFAVKRRVFLVQTSVGFPVDIALGLPGYEDELISRAINYVVEPGKTIRLCSAEDLILQKVVANRPQDIRDIEGVVIRQGTNLDLAYIRHWLKIFAEWLETDDIIDRFEMPWQKFQSYR
jgi:hypothetical protein